MRHLRPVSALAAAVLTAALVPAALAPAAAVVADQVRYAGTSIWRQSLPAQPVALEVWSSTAAASVDLVLGGAVVATDTTVVAADGYWVADATVDLTGLSGAQTITMRVNPVGAASRSSVKEFSVVAPTAPAPAPAPTPTPTPEPTPTATTAPAPTSTTAETTTTTTIQPDQIRFAGASIYKAVLPGAAALPLEVWSSTAASRIEVLLGSTVLATDTTVEARPGYWLAAVNVNLSGLPKGAASLTMRVTPTSGAVRSSSKSFTVDPVIAPLTSAILAARPSAASTGVPAGVTLRPSGSLKITVPGTVVDGLDIAGCVIVAADNVTIRNSRVRCTTPTKSRAIMAEGVRTGTLIENVEVDGGGVTDIGVDISNAVLRRLDVHHVNDGVRLGSNIQLLDSWVHDMSRKGELHPDAVQGISAQNIVIRNNVLDPRDPVSGDNGNAAIQLGSETGTMLSKNVVIENNLLDGGNCSLNIRYDINAEGFTIRGNRFGTASQYGPVLLPARVPLASTNVMDTWGTAIKVQYTS